MIIVKTGFIKGTKHKEYYVNYIATRDGVETFQFDGESKPITKGQQKIIHDILDDFPEYKEDQKYIGFQDNMNRKTASIFIQKVMKEKIEDVKTKENYVDYIANRPRVEKLGEHGLFSDEGLDFQLKDVVKEVGKHEGNVWTFIISLTREEAQRTGYEDVNQWMRLCQSKRNELAKLMKIPPSNLKWFGAFHNEGHHPHVHMIVYSENIKEGFLTKNNLKKIKSMYTKEIFHSELKNLYQHQTHSRNQLKRFSKEKVEEILNKIENKEFENKRMESLIIDLKNSLKNYQGRLYYAYVPADTKNLVNEIVCELEKDEDIKKLYDEWFLYRTQIVHHYHNQPLEQYPLSAQKELKGIKNIILQEVMKSDLPLRMHDKENMILLTTKLFHHLGKIFESDMPIQRDNPLASVDKKLKRKLLRKRSELGHKEDDQTLLF